MSLFCLGVNHKSASVDVRERLAVAQHALAEHLHNVHGLDAVDETVILSTCNRVEVYGAAAENASAIASVRDYLNKTFEMAPGAVDFYELSDEEAANHLFEVASGLDSLVIGETEIFGQVKKAYSVAQSEKATSRYLNKLFQQSFSVGKLVRTTTKIQQGSTSIGAVAVDLAEQIFGNLKGCKVMILGAGEMSRTTAQSLVSRGASSIIVSNRSFDKAEELAGELDGRAIRFDDWERSAADVDVIVSSTSAPHYIVTREAVEAAMRARPARSLFIIDIAVPRDVDPQVNQVENAYLYNIDQLQQIAADGKAQREKQLKICRGVIRDYLEEKGIEALREPRSGKPKPDASTSSADPSYTAGPLPPHS